MARSKPASVVRYMEFATLGFSAVLAALEALTSAPSPLDPAILAGLAVASKVIRAILTATKKVRASEPSVVSWIVAVALAVFSVLVPGAKEVAHDEPAQVVTTSGGDIAPAAADAAVGVDPGRDTGLRDVLRDVRDAKE